MWPVNRPLADRVGKISQLPQRFWYVRILVHPEVACANLTLTQVVLCSRADDSPHQGVPRLMDRQDLQLEELQIPKPIRLPFHGLDLVVGPLQRTTRDHH